MNAGPRLVRFHQQHNTDAAALRELCRVHPDLYKTFVATARNVIKKLRADGRTLAPKRIDKPVIDIGAGNGGAA